MLLNESADRLYALAEWSRRQYEETGCAYSELDAQACEAAAAVVTAACGEGAETEKDAERIIRGYPMIRQRLRRMQGHFDTVGEPIPRDGGVYVCPVCFHHVRLCNNYCCWCGKAIRTRKRGENKW